MDETIVSGEVAVPTDGGAAEVFQPGVGSLNFPAAFISPELFPVFVRSVHTIVTVRNNEVDAMFGKTLSQTVIVVTFVPEMTCFGINCLGCL